MKALVIFIAVLAVAGGLVFAHFQMRKERGLEAEAEAPIVPPSRVEYGPEGAAIVRLDVDTQRRLGLRAVPPTPGTVAVELSAAARVLEGAGLSGMLQELKSAQSALEAANADHRRKERLFENGRNASASAVEQAAALAAQRALEVEALRDRAVAAWGPALAARDDLPELAQALLRREAALVRVDLPPAAWLASPPARLHLRRPVGEEAATASVLGIAPSAEPAFAGQSLLCLATNNTAWLVAGSALLARLPTGAVEQGVVLPRGAVLRHAGLGWVYVQTGPETFSRRAAPLTRPHPDGWLADGAWPQPVVAAGAQSLLSEELKGALQLKD